MITIYDESAFGKVRYFRSDRCFNTVSLQEFNKNRIKAEELVTFDSGLMDMTEIKEMEIKQPEKDEQILAVIVRPEIEPDDMLEKDGQFEFCGYDLTEFLTCTSAITNCGAMFEDAIKYHELNEYGLISSYREAVTAQLDLYEKYPQESHAYCEIIEIWRLKTTVRL